MNIRVKRVYDPPETEDGARFLVDRLWPRGKKREDLRLDGWVKEAAPSAELRGWYHHQPELWEAFCARYFAELDANPAAWQPLLHAARQDTLTLLYAARDDQYNNARALQMYLEQNEGAV